MKIAVVGQTFLPAVGGSEFVMHYLAREWVRQGHSVCVVNSFTDQVVRPEDGYTVRKYKLVRGGGRFGYHRFPFQWHTVRELRRVLNDLRPDLISAQYGYPTAHWLCQIEPQPKFLVTCHGTDLTTFEWGYRQTYGIDRELRDALNSSRAAIAISRHAQQLMLELGVRPEKIAQIPNGVDWERYQKVASFDWRGSLSLSRNAKVILSLGRNIPAKAYPTGIRAFARIAPQFPDTYYAIVGKATDALADLVRELGIQGRVILHAGLHGEQLVGACRQSDIFFMPSVQEMFPLVIVEAMAAGLPVVATDIAGSQDVIATGRNGALVPPENVEAMAAALTHLLSEEKLRKELGAFNRQVARDYDWSRISERYLEAAR